MTQKFKTFIRKCIYLILGFFDVITRKQPKIFILCYHSIASDSWRYGVSLTTIEKQLQYLKSKYIPITIQDVEDVILGKKVLNQSSFLVTFDDGYKEVLFVKKLVKSLGIKPTLFVLTNNKKANYTELTTKRKFLSTNDIRQLIEEGWNLGCHSATHSDFWKLSDKEIIDEIVTSKKYLEKTLQMRIKYFAYPRGRYTDKILKTIKDSGYILGLSMNDGEISSYTNQFIVPRIGVDRTHSFTEFKTLFMPSVILFRKFIKERIGVII